MSFNLRKRTPISYYEPEEPAFDKYTFCEQCADYVLEYCAIHGPLLVIPDNKVPSKPNFPSYVPRAALTIPHVFLHLAPSIIPGAGLGVFSTLTLPRGVRFGPYRGQRTEHVDSMYCWQIFSSNNKRSHVVDAADADRSNWMRYVNCARHWREQNLLAYQYKGQLYYRTIKTIPRFTELMVFYGSEFANVLNISLKQYNSPCVYVLHYGTQKANKTSLEKPKESNSIVPTEYNETSDMKENEGKEYSDEVINYNKVENNNLTFKNNVVRDENVINIVSTKNKTIETSNLNNAGKYNLALGNNTNSCDGTDTLNNSNVSNILKPFICDMCSYSCGKRSCLVRHIRKHTGEKPYECDFCQHRFGRKSYLTRHILIHTGTKSHKCSICQKSFSTKSGLIRHHQIHTGEKPYKCDVCQRSFTERYHLTGHIRTHAGEKPYNCDICQNSFSRKSNLTVHISTHHTGEKSYKCDVCQRSFSQRHHLTGHIQTHTGVIPFECDICQRSFTQRSKLIRHNFIHTREKPYKCEICQSTFSYNYSLTRHMRNHTGEKPYNCDICQRSFTEKSNLVRHIRGHTGETPHKCDFCPRKFSHPNSLTRHMRTHTGEKPYTCDICQKCFSQRYTLVEHIRIHTGEKPFTCDICPQSFRNRRILTAHIRLHMGNNE